MKDVTLYEDEAGVLWRPYDLSDEHGKPVPAVVGITVAQVEAAERAADAYQAEMREAARERDEARAAARAATEDMADWRDRADRYWEALERIIAQLDPLYRIASDATTATEIAREALGGGDD